MSTNPTSRKDDARIRVRARFRQFLRFESIRTATSLYQLLEDIAAEKYPDRPWDSGFDHDHHYGVAKFKGKKR
jgi:hypothetical protein